MDITVALSTRIKEILEQKNIKKSELSKLTGLYRSTINCLLNCTYSSANIKTLFIILQALDITVLEFFDSPLFKDLNNLNLE